MDSPGAAVLRQEPVFRKEAVFRKEDRRLLTGRGRYVGDLTRPGMLEVAFVRSPYGHARVTRVSTAAAEGLPGVVAVVTGDDPELRRISLRARSRLSTYVETAQPVLAREKVRYAGEAVAVVVAVDRATAEDAAELVEVFYEPLPVVVDVLQAGEWAGPGAPAPLHDEAPDNVLVHRRFERGDVDAALAGATLLVERSMRTNRVTAAPMEGRAGLAEWSDADDRLIFWSGTQVPHVARHFLAEMLGLAEGRIRVVAPDVGGGFGVKATLYPEDVALCVLARRLGVPVRFVEDRLEGLLTDTHARDHAYEVVAGFDSDGCLLGLRARVACNVGAYSILPWTCGIEALMAGGLLVGPYRLEHYRCEASGVATNTTPAGPYRGVARPSTVFVMERVLDQAARELGVDPAEIRRRNLITPEDLPYVSASGLVHDSPTYLAVLERTLERAGYQALRADQERLRLEGRYVGIGLACYNELTGLGRATPAGPGLAFRTGHDAVLVRMDPGGAVTVIAGATSQGQGLETTIAQVVAAELGVAFGDVDVRLGDTDAGVWGMGAFSSRQGVITGGAAALAARELRAKVVSVAAHLLEVSPADLDVAGGRVFPRDAPTRGMTLREVGRVAYLETDRLPPDLEPGLEATRFYDPIRGTFAAGAQLAVVEVHPETGMLDILSYWCVEDTGRVVNRSIVRGQVEGAIAQGIGGALYEHLVYDKQGQLTTGTFMDYLLPAAPEIPALHLDHLEVPADNVLGVRGVGEGGTLGSAAALSGAVVDALSCFGVDFDDLPISPGAIWAALDRKGAFATRPAENPLAGRVPDDGPGLEEATRLAIEAIAEEPWERWW